MMVCKREIENQEHIGGRVYLGVFLRSQIFVLNTNHLLDPD